MNHPHPSNSQLRAPADGVAFPDTAGLVFTHDGMPGYTRRKSGRGFSYLLPGGEVLRDRLEKARILSLAIPPAYRDVWICRHPRGHLQATGFDDRGRKQYRYHPDWTKYSNELKFENLPEFAKALPRIRRRVQKELSKSTLDSSRIIAGIVALLDRTGYRIGNERYARDNRSYGLVSLLTRHLFEDNGRWMLRFKGKSGRLHESVIDDPKIATLVAELHELPGQHLFRYEDESGGWRDVGSGEVNAWLKEHGGGNFSAKQFRTWKATLLFARELGKEPPAETKTARRLAGTAAIRATAGKLRHTPATCRAYYLHPAVAAAYAGGALYRIMHARAPLLRKSDDSRLLFADERRLLKILELSP